MGVFRDTQHMLGPFEEKEAPPRTGHAAEFDLAAGSEYDPEALAGDKRDETGRLPWS